MLWLYIIVFIGSCLLLIKSGAWVVKSLVRIAHDLEWSEFFVAFILMSFTTTLPELFVGITAAFHGRPGLSFGNVVGSNVINLTLATGIAVILASGITLAKTVAKRDSLWTVLFASLPILLILDGSLSRIDGVSLIVGLIVYISAIVRTRVRGNKVLTPRINGAFKRFKLLLRDISVFFGGILLLLLSAEGIVRSSTALATIMRFPLVLIGILVVALGTNLPEIVFSIRAVLSKHKEMVLGNLMGAVVINSTLVLGLTCLIHPFRIANFNPLIAGMVWTIVVSFFFYFFARSYESLSRKEGIFLIELYILFIIVQFLVQ